MVMKPSDCIYKLDGMSNSSVRLIQQIELDFKNSKRILENKSITVPVHFTWNLSIGDDFNSIESDINIAVLYYNQIGGWKSVTAKYDSPKLYLEKYPYSSVVILNISFTFLAP